MKKALIVFTVCVALIITMPLITAYVVIQTHYAPQFISQLVHRLTPYTLSTSNVEYTSLYQLTLDDVLLTGDSLQLRLPKLTLWFGSMPIQKGKLTFDSILIEGATLASNDISHRFLQGLKIHQLAFKHSDISGDGWSARDADLQISQPTWEDDEQQLPYGNIQLRTDQLYIHGTALNDFFLNMRSQKYNSTVLASSFEWQGAAISGQAEQYKNQWSLVNVTVKDLSLGKEDSITNIINSTKALNLPIDHINSLDLINSSFYYQEWQVEHLDASFENIALNQPLWQQSDGYLSFNADKISFENIDFISPQAKLKLHENTMTLAELDTDIKEGRLQMKGTFSPNHVHLTQFSILGVKWLDNTNHIVMSISDMISPLMSLNIDQLEVKNSQFIQVIEKPYWQVTGLGIEGSQLSLIKNKRIGLWSGKLELAANSASIDNLISNQAQVKLEANDGVLKLNRAFIPLEKGYIEANGQWNRQIVSEPWQLTLYADGIPLNHYNIERALPIRFTGLAELNLNLKGLSGDYLMLSNSLSGQADIELRQVAIDADNLDGTSHYQHALDLDAISVLADRGRIDIANHKQVAGHLDLTNSEFSSFIFHDKQPCFELWSDLIGRVNVIKDICTKKTTRHWKHQPL